MRGTLELEKKMWYTFCIHPRQPGKRKEGSAMFFNSDYNDLMPDHPEEDDPSFLGLLGRGSGALLKANLLFVLCCVPLVTLPIGLFAMNRVAHQAAEDQPVECLQIFKETFRRYWKQSYLAFLTTLFPLVCAGYGALFYLQAVSTSPLFFLPFLVCSTIFLLATLSSLGLYALMDSGKEWKEALRLALLLGVVKPLRSIPAALCGYGLPLVAILLFPLSGLYLVLIGFSIPCMAGHYILRPVVRQITGEAVIGAAEEE